MHYVSRDRLLALAGKYPTSMRRIRWCAIVLALQRELCILVQFAKAAAALEELQRKQGAKEGGGGGEEEEGEAYKVTQPYWNNTALIPPRVELLTCDAEKDRVAKAYDGLLAWRKKEGVRFGQNSLLVREFSQFTTHDGGLQPGAQPATVGTERKALAVAAFAGSRAMPADGRSSSGARGADTPATGCGAVGCWDSRAGGADGADEARYEARYESVVAGLGAVREAQLEQAAALQTLSSSVDRLGQQLVALLQLQAPLLPPPSGATSWAGAPSSRSQPPLDASAETSEGVMNVAAALDRMWDVSGHAPGQAAAPRGGEAQPAYSGTLEA